VRTVNEQLLDAQILWQVLLLRFSLHVRQKVIDALNGTEREVASQIRGTLAIEQGFRDPRATAELERLLQNLEVLRRRAWEDGSRAAQEELTNLSQAEINQQHDLYGAWLPSLSKPLWLVAGASALAAPFQGRTFAQWLEDSRTAETKRIRSAIYGAVGRGERADVIARIVVGSARNMGTDGATQVSRNHIDTITRSGVVHVSAWVRDQFFRLNPQVLDLEQFLAVLDSQTTPLCRGLNGNRYPIGTGPMPPLHMGCRSTRYAVLPRDVGGPVPEPEVYDSWIRKQSRAVQVELMGATRAQRMRAGTFDPGRFTDYGTKRMTLKQVAAAAKRLMG
jgi:hypothetical protein